MRTQLEQNFSDFFETWVAQLEELVKRLLNASTDDDAITNEAELRGLVSTLTTHFKLYYTVKWAHAHQDVLAFFSPAWLSPLETAYTWVTGWKPSMAFRLMAHAPAMSEDQAMKIEELRVKIKSEEEKVEREMERQQMAMADQQMVELSRLESRRRKGDQVVLAGREVEGLVEVAIKTLLVGLERTMKAADCVRLKTLKGILEVLSPLQCVNFLASISLIQIRLREWGKRKAAQKYD